MPEAETPLSTVEDEQAKLQEMVQSLEKDQRSKNKDLEDKVGNVILAELSEVGKSA